LLRAGALSLVGHACLLGVVATNAQQQPVAASEDLGALWVDAAAAAASPTWVDLRAASEALPEPEPAEPLPAADEARREEIEQAPARGATGERARAATDTGEDAGRQAPAAARRDTSTLRSRLADNASDNQASHERTGARAASPQPIRQEPRVGVGDSSRTRRRSPADSLASNEALPSDPDGAFDPRSAAAPGESQQTDTGRDLARGDGPLDVEKGRRRFDVDTYGVAADSRNARAASSEPRPGRLDLSAPAAAGPSQAGQGPGAAPGATSQPSSGEAPATFGANRPAERGPDLAMSAAEREYQRNFAEIQRRVSRSLRFPRRLALEMEQGETVVHFQLRPDGRIDGAVRIVKSAGFEEFDAEAVNAVNRAAPFPPMSRAVSISMPISFENPLVR
jgi:TonB family protein